MTTSTPRLYKIVKAQKSLVDAISNLRWMAREDQVPEKVILDRTYKTLQKASKELQSFIEGEK